MTKYRKGTGGEKTVYHTNKDCPQLDNANAIETTDRFIEWHEMRECQFCEGSVVIHNEGDTNNEQVS